MPAKVTHAVATGVEKRPRIDLIHDRAAPPGRGRRIPVTIHGPADPKRLPSGPAHADLWFKNAVVDSLTSTRSWTRTATAAATSRGSRCKLDYLDGLGVDTLWLALFQPTPGRDDGDDITDHLGVYPRFGTSGDFVEFMHEAESRGMRVIVHLVVNHTVRSASLVQGRPLQPGRRPARLVRVVGQAPARLGHRHGVPGRAAGDLELRSGASGAGTSTASTTSSPISTCPIPIVREEIRRIIGYWLELGVAGFRVDAVPFALEKPSVDGGKARLQFDWLHDIREFLQWRTGTPRRSARRTSCPARRRSISPTATGCT